VTFYQAGFDHHDNEDRHRVREWLKEEFNGEIVELGGKVHWIAKTTKGRDQLQPFLERVLARVMENYEPPPEALNPMRIKLGGTPCSRSVGRTTISTTSANWAAYEPMNRH
jgi:hypothetical protein